MGFILNKVIIFIVIAGVLIAGAVFYFNRGSKEPSYDFIVAQKGNLIQEVSVTGRVRAVQNVDLAFEKGGKIANVYAKVGDAAESAQELVRLDSSELQAQLNQARADLDYANSQLSQARVSADIERAKLAQLKRGTRAEEIQIAQTKVSNAQKVLDDAKVNLVNVKRKADADIQEDYDGALSAAASSVTVGIDALFTLTNIQSAHFYGSYQIDIKIADAKADAVFALLGGVNAGKASNDFISQLNGGAKATVQTAELSRAYENINKALVEVKNALDKIKIALDLITIDLLSASEKTNLNTAKTNSNTEITAISGKEAAIEVQRATNSSAVSTAEAKVNDAENAFFSAKDELALKQAGVRAEDIEVQEHQVSKADASVAAEIAQVNKARAAVENYQAQIEKTVIRSPISGIITRQDAKAGEIISANQVVITVMSNAVFEIEASVAEVDIPKISVSDSAKITLDSYGNDVIFEALVMAIDPAEIIIEGVATYKVTLQFKKEDSRIKSGMTANVSILTDNRDNVIYVPQRAVIQKNGGKIVRIGDVETIRDVKVETGLYASDGNVEIVAGVNEGDKVVTFLLEK